MPSSTAIAAVIPTYNRAHLLGRAIDSVLRQTHPPSEILVIDDGSGDDTAEVCGRYGGRLRYVRQCNGGAAAARNTGAQLARAPWIAFLDSDDVWDPGHLERIESAIRTTGGRADIYFSDLALPENEGGGTLWGTTGFIVDRPFSLAPDAAAWMLRPRQPAMVQCSVFRAAALRESGGFDVTYPVAEDTELFCRLGIGGPACAVAGVGCQQTADDAADNRLTGMPVHRTATYLHCRLRLWRGVLGRHRRLPAPQRRLVRFHLAEAYNGVGRGLWRSGRRLAALWQAAQGAAADPRLAVWRLRRGTVPGYEEWLRNCGAKAPPPAREDW